MSQATSSQPKILLLGSQGQVGEELQHILSSASELMALSRSQLDLAHPQRLPDLIAEIQPQVIINAAAYTAVDRAESEPELAEIVNAKVPRELAIAARQCHALLVHLSTDYVFAGQQSTPYRETDPTAPLSVYGRTKLAGEEGIRQVWDRHLILRTAWVYGAYGKGNFVKTMLRLGAERSELRVVADQVGSPTWAADLAGAIAHLVQHFQPDWAGTYHYTNSGVASWYDFALAIFEEAHQRGFKLQVERVIPITTPEYPTPATRPAYSVLNCQKISTLLGTAPPHWRQSLRQMLTDLSTQNSST